MADSPRVRYRMEHGALPHWMKVAAALNAFLAAVEAGNAECCQVCNEWSVREGDETYTYLTADELLIEVAVNSVPATPARSTVLLPSGSEDIVVR